MSNIGIAAPLSLALIYGLGCIGMLMVFRYLAFPDFSSIGVMTASGPFTVFIGERLAAWGYAAPVMGLFGATLCGGALGLVTTLQINRLRLTPIIAGIATFAFANFVAYAFAGGQAAYYFSKLTPRYIAPITLQVFSWRTVVILISAIVLTAHLLRRLFASHHGLYIMALQADPEYLRIRHTQVSAAKATVLVTGNGIIGLAAGFAALHENGANIPNHPDFLIVALSAFGFSTFAVSLIRRRYFREYMSKDDVVKSTTTGKLLLLVLPALGKALCLNEEEPQRIFCTFLLQALFGAIVYCIFRLCEFHFGQHVEWFVKGVVLIGFMSLGVISERNSQIQT